MNSAFSQFFADDVADAVTAGKSRLLTFDDIAMPAQGYTPMPAGYGGLTWSADFDVMNPDVLLAGAGYDGSGFFTGRTSGQQIAWNNDGVPVKISASGQFDLKSAELTAGTDRKLVVDVYAYKDGAEVGHHKVTLTDTAATLVNLNFKGVDEVDFVPGKGVPDKKFNSGTFIVFDDLTVSNVVNGQDRVTGRFDKPHETSATSAADHLGHPAVDHLPPLQLADHPLL